MKAVELTWSTCGRWGHRGTLYPHCNKVGAGEVCRMR